MPRTARCASGSGRASAPPREYWFRGSCRLFDLVNTPGLRRLQLLGFSGRPADEHAIDGRLCAQAEVEAALILGAKSRSAGDFLDLLAPVPEQLDAGADRAAVGAGADIRVTAAPAAQIER